MSRPNKTITDAMKIKVCGMREADNILAVDALGVDYMGFIFYPRSARFVSVPPHDMPVHAKRVGVFVNADTTDILQHIETYGLDIVQLHGNETPQQCSEVREKARTLDHEVGIWKAISLQTNSDMLLCEPYSEVVDGFVFDTKCASYGGSGNKYDWSLLETYDVPVPFLLSGGIGPDDVHAIKQFHHPQFAGIDLNSRFETSPAYKDLHCLTTFIQAIKNN